MIPTTIAEAIEELKNMLDAKEIGMCMRLTEKEGLNRVHHSLGRWIRNTWGLWTKDSLLYMHLHEYGLWHADDMSDVILKAFYRELHGLPWEIEKEVERYNKHWANMNVQPE